METFQSLGSRSYERPWVKKSLNLSHVLMSPSKDPLTKRTEKALVAFYSLLVKEHITGLVTLSKLVTESVSFQALIGGLLRQRGLSVLFEDLEHVDRFIRKTSCRLICDLAFQSKPNAEQILQQNGFTFNGIRVFSIPERFKSAFDQYCIDTHQTETDVSALIGYLQGFVTAAPRSDSERFWSFPPQEVQDASGRDFPDPKDYLVGFFIPGTDLSATQSTANPIVVYVQWIRQHFGQFFPSTPTVDTLARRKAILAATLPKPQLASPASTVGKLERKRAQSAPTLKKSKSLITRALFNNLEKEWQRFSEYNIESTLGMQLTPSAYSYKHKSAAAKARLINMLSHSSEFDELKTLELKNGLTRRSSIGSVLKDSVVYYDPLPLTPTTVRLEELVGRLSPTNQDERSPFITPKKSPPRKTVSLDSPGTPNKAGYEPLSAEPLERKLSFKAPERPRSVGGVLHRPESATHGPEKSKRALQQAQQWGTDDFSDMSLPQLNALLPHQIFDLPPEQLMLLLRQRRKLQVKEISELKHIVTNTRS